YVVQTWHDAMGTSIDKVTLANWTAQLDSGLLPSEFAYEVTHSDTYYASVITPIYSHYLGRAPDAAGLDYWVDRMQHGLTDEQLEAGFIGSAEYYQRAGNTNAGWVDALYRDLLGRDADAQGEAYWEARLAAGSQRGDVALGFTASMERERTR